jgi:hypothetical protein
MDASCELGSPARVFITPSVAFFRRLRYLRDVSFDAHLPTTTLGWCVVRSVFCSCSAGNRIVDRRESIVRFWPLPCNFREVSTRRLVGASAGIRRMSSCCLRAC